MSCRPAGRSPGSQSPPRHRAALPALKAVYDLAGIFTVGWLLAEAVLVPQVGSPWRAVSALTPKEPVGRVQSDAADMTWIGASLEGSGGG